MLRNPHSFSYVLELNKEKWILDCIIKTVLNDPILFVNWSFTLTKILLG